MLHTSFRSSAAQRPTELAVDGEPQGVLVPTADGYRFLAVRLGAFTIDGQTFASPEAAQLALRNVLHARDSQEPAAR